MATLITPQPVAHTAPSLPRRTAAQLAASAEARDEREFRCLRADLRHQLQRRDRAVRELAGAVTPWTLACAKAAVAAVARAEARILISIGAE